MPFFLAITTMNIYKTMQTENIYCQRPKALAEIKQPFPETSDKKKSSFSKTDEASAEGWTAYRDISGEMC